MESDKEKLSIPSITNDEPSAPLVVKSKKKRLQMKIQIAIKHSEADPKSFDDG